MGWFRSRSNRTVDPVGQWRVAVGDPGITAFGDHAVTFTAEGELIYSVLDEGVATSRMLLTDRLEGETIVSNQPSAPREERTRIASTEKGLLLGDPPMLLTRDRQFRSDPLAPALALGLAALERTLGPGAPAGTLRPFLLCQFPSERKIICISGDDGAALRGEAVRAFAKVRTAASAVAWTCGDRISLPEGERDVVVVEVSCAQAPRGLRLIQPCALSGATIARDGALAAVDCEAWFAEA